ncbi:MAG: hypothetical protein DHS20C18_29310 [Saprospiraceae bacterium]|nr:MAG: hypothetical protein DHS20C18_29310 [Saprospiraceae bacterium]
MSKPVPILSLRLLDIPIPARPGDKQLLLTGAKDLLRTYKDRCEVAGVDINLFHNKEVIYSGIQLSKYQSGSEWTAIGEECVRALELWYLLFKETHPVQLEHVVEIREYYTPAFLPYHRFYQANALLISDVLARELNEIEDNFRRMDRVERYIYGNLMTFFQYIGFEFNKDFHFLKVQVADIGMYDKALPVFHSQKKTALRVHFKCNFRLPQNLRLGQSTALGFGNIITVSGKKIKNQKYQNDERKMSNF